MYGAYETIENRPGLAQAGVRDELADRARCLA